MIILMAMSRFPEKMICSRSILEMDQTLINAKEKDVFVNIFLNNPKRLSSILLYKIVTRQP